MNKIIITVMVEGGVVQKVCTTGGPSELRVMVIDHDSQEEGAVMVPYVDGNNFPASVGFMQLDPVDFDMDRLLELCAQGGES